MIPMMNIVAWGNVVPWGEQRQVEQDLIISRAIIDLFADPLLREQFRFRGGTALNKLHFPAPVRYSEDIDLVRTTAGPIGPILDRVRERLEPWLGRGNFEQSQVAPKLRFRAQAEDPAAQIRLKVEINTWEIEAYDAPQAISFRADNPWFAGNAEIPTFSREEMLATKLRAASAQQRTRSVRPCSQPRRIRGPERSARGRVFRAIPSKIGDENLPRRGGTTDVREAEQPRIPCRSAPLARGDASSAAD